MGTVIRITLYQVKIILMSLSILLLLAGTSSSWLSTYAQTQTALDTTPPDTEITSAVDGEGKPVQNGGTTSSNNIRFMFRGIDSTGAASNFQCSIDNKPYSTCASGTLFPSLSAGGHSFAVAASDSSGKIDQSPAIFQWSISELLQPNSDDTSQPQTSSRSDMAAQSEQSSSVSESGGGPSSSNMRQSNQLSIQAATCSGAEPSYTCVVDEGETLTWEYMCWAGNPSTIVQCTMGSGPAGSSFISGTGNPAFATFSWPNAGPPGTYTAGPFSVVCLNNPCLPDPLPDTLTIKVNHPPVANAGPDQTVKAEDTVTLNGAGSSDADNDPLTYSWSQIFGTPSVSLDNPSVSTPTFTAPSVNKKTTLTFQLMVNDGRVDSKDSDTVDVVIEPGCGCGTQSAVTAVSSSSTAGCSIKVPTLVVRNDRPYSIQASTLVEASTKFVQANRGIAGLTTWTEPVDSGIKLDENGRIVCVAALTQQVTVQLPVWTNIGTLCAPIQDEWSKRFLPAVTGYEQEHVDLVKKTLDDFAKKIIGKTAQEANNLLLKLYGDLQQKSDQIDASGKHSYNNKKWLAIDTCTK